MSDSIKADILQLEAYRRKRAGSRRTVQVLEIADIEARLGSWRSKRGSAWINDEEAVDEGRMG